MSNGDDDSAASNGNAEPADDSEELPVESLDDRLDDVESDLEEAESEADLDEVEATLDAIESDIEATDFPEPDDEDDESLADQLESRASDLRDELDDSRGPYAEDVSDAITDTAETLTQTQWTKDGAPEARDAVESFLTAASDHFDASFGAPTDEFDDLGAALEDVGSTVLESDLDPDEDADQIADLLELTDELSSALENAEEWDDLSVREQLDAEGFYERLTAENRKDFPPELTVIRIAEAENDPERILLALETFESDFMEENCIDALRRLGSPSAFEPMEARAQRRDTDAIEVLGKIGDERAVETLVEFVDSGNPPLQKATLRALGEIGSQEATEASAQALLDEDASVRSAAARALGLIGDTRAIEPLADILDDDAVDTVRASAAWSLNQIGTERALEEVSTYADDRTYIVQTEAKKAREANAI
ncbi:MAG: HEAT repeat domain-containing protein [Natronomonas sp.]